MGWKIAEGRRLRSVAAGETKEEKEEYRRSHVLAERLYLKDENLWPRIVARVVVGSWYMLPEDRGPSVSNFKIYFEQKSGPGEWWNSDIMVPAEILWDLPDMLREAADNLDKRLEEDDFYRFQSPGKRSEYARRKKESKKR